MLRAPIQTFLRTPPSQAFLDPMTLHKHIHIHQILNALFLGQRPRTVPVATPQQVIYQQPVQPHPRPLVVLDIGQTGDLVQIL